MVIDPNAPETFAPTEPDALTETPATTPSTAIESPVSMSVSFVNTLPDGFMPAVPFAVPPASTAIAASETATGVSLLSVTQIVNNCVAVDRSLLAA